MTDTPIQKEFMKLISSNYGIITNVLNTYVDIEHHADVQQDILLRAWKGYPAFKGESKFSTWLHRVAVNTAVDHLRARRTIDAPITYEDPGPDLLEIAFTWLTEMEREMVALYIQTSLSGPKTAKLLRLPVASFYYKLNKIKQSIRKTYPGQ